jgi:isocitrate dehydrogenase
VQLASTQEFAEAVIARLGNTPERLLPVRLNKDAKPIEINIKPSPKVNKQLVGVDVFIDWSEKDRNPDILGKRLEEIAGEGLQLKMITNRGVKVYPNGFPETFCTDHWRCRFVSAASRLKEEGSGMKKVTQVSYEEVTNLLQRLNVEGLDFIKIENLYEIDGARAYSLGQGE